MTQVTVSDLKAQLSRYLDSVREGSEILITDRGIPVARLCPLTSPQATNAREQSLIRAGLLRAPTSKLPPGFWNQWKPKDPNGLALGHLLEEREGTR